MVSLSFPAGAGETVMLAMSFLDSCAADLIHVFFLHHCSRESLYGELELPLRVAVLRLCTYEMCGQQGVSVGG